MNDMALLAAMVDLARKTTEKLAGADFDPDEMARLAAERQALFARLQLIVTSGTPQRSLEGGRLVRALFEQDARLAELAARHQARIMENIVAARTERQGLQAYANRAALSGSRLDIKGI